MEGFTFDTQKNSRREQTVSEGAIKMKKKLNVVGIMNGTSLDGVDCAFCQITPTTMKLLDQACFKFPNPLHQKLLKAVNHSLSVDQLAELDFDLGRFYALKLRPYKTRWKMDLIGLHGQTVYHKGGQASLQIGQPSFLASQLQVPVVSRFRAMDIAMGGQGAPLATLFHHKVLAQRACRWLSPKAKNPHHLIAIQNIGGIANVTFVGKKDKVMAYDIGPGNVLMDTLIRQITNGKSLYDRGGTLAFQGIPHTVLLKKWMKTPCFLKKPPKSFDRRDFAGPFFQKCLKDMKGLPANDQMATLADLTAQLMATSYRVHLPSCPEIMVVCGGGALNPYLLHRIKYALATTFQNPPSVITSEDLNWPIDSVEATAFALLAAYSYWKKPTDPLKKTILGDLTQI